MIAGTYHGDGGDRRRSSPAASWPARSSRSATGVSGWRPGDRVMAMGRGYAELAVVDAALGDAGAGRRSAWSAAGALPVALATMHDALVTNGGFDAGDHVVVNAASSGVGVVGVRIGPARSARPS